MTTPRWTPGIERVLEGMRDTEGWVVIGGAIRRPIADGFGCCPITSLDGVDAEHFLSVARSFGIAGDEPDRIVDTADDMVCSLNYDPALRTAMIEAGRIEA